MYIYIYMNLIEFTSPTKVLYLFGDILLTQCNCTKSLQVSGFDWNLICCHHLLIVGIKPPRLGLNGNVAPHHCFPDNTCDIGMSLYWRWIHFLNNNVNIHIATTKLQLLPRDRSSKSISWDLEERNSRGICNHNPSMSTMWC